MKPKLTEAQFTTQVIAIAHQGFWLAAHFRPARVGAGDRWVTPMQGDTGFPDLVLSRLGVTIAAELKLDGKTYGKGQAEWAEAMGAIHRLWTPSMLDQIKGELAWDWRTMKHPPPESSTSRSASEWRSSTIRRGAVQRAVTPKTPRR